jgi:hypothetical protein
MKIKNFLKNVIIVSIGIMVVILIFSILIGLNMLRSTKMPGIESTGNHVADGQEPEAPFREIESFWFECPNCKKWLPIFHECKRGEK